MTAARSAMLGMALLAVAGSQAWADGKDEILAADRAFSALSVAKGVAYAFWQYSSRSARLYGDHGPPKIGKAARAPAPGKDKSALRWAPTAAGADGNLGWSDGTWTLSGPDGTDNGHYLTVWVREDGAWKMQADMGTTDPRTVKSGIKP